MQMPEPTLLETEMVLPEEEAAASWKTYLISLVEEAKDKPEHKEDKLVPSKKLKEDKLVPNKKPKEDKVLNQLKEAKALNKKLKEDKVPNQLKEDKEPKQPPLLVEEEEEIKVELYQFMGRL
jgi:hypothetical protein